MHFDIKLPNVFYYFPTKTYFLCDFGGAKKITSNNFNINTLLVDEVKEYSDVYACPKFVIEKDINDNKNEYINPYKFDVYSLGLCMMKLLCTDKITLENYNLNLKLYDESLKLKDS